jgi:hypothetical protein
MSEGTVQDPAKRDTLKKLVLIGAGIFGLNTAANVVTKVAGEVTGRHEDLSYEPIQKFLEVFKNAQDPEYYQKNLYEISKLLLERDLPSNISKLTLTNSWHLPDSSTNHLEIIKNSNEVSFDINSNVKTYKTSELMMEDIATELKNVIDSNSPSNLGYLNLGIEFSHIAQVDKSKISPEIVQDIPQDKIDINHKQSYFVYGVDDKSKTTTDSLGLSKKNYIARVETLYFKEDASGKFTYSDTETDYEIASTVFPSPIRIPTIKRLPIFVQIADLYNNAAKAEGK